MTTPLSGLSGLAYQLGEIRDTYKNASGFAAANLADNPDLWGWGNYHATDKGLLDLMVASATASLERSPVSAGEIDAVFLCSSCLDPAIGEHCGFTREFLVRTGLTKSQCTGVTLKGCSTFLSVVELAASTVRAGLYGNALIVTADLVESGKDRFRPYAIFSDGAASCIVTSQITPGGLVIRATASASDSEQMFSDAPFSDDLALATNEAALNRAGARPDDVKHLFCNNLFLPVITMKETEAGIDEEALFVDNIHDKGHCFGADALINLCDFLGDRSLEAGDIAMLASDAPGTRTTILIEQSAT